MFWDSGSIQLYTCDTLFDVIPESGPQNMAHPFFLGSSDIVPWDPSHQTQPEKMIIMEAAPAVDPNLQMPTRSFWSFIMFRLQS